MLDHQWLYNSVDVCEDSMATTKKAQWHNHYGSKKRIQFFLVLVVIMLKMLWVQPGFSASKARVSDSPTDLSEVLEDDLQYMKEETVVTPMRREQPISESPSNIYVITAEDIQQSGATDLPTILRRVPGMEVMQTTGADFNVSVRGNNQLFTNKLLVLLDGRSIFLDAQGLVKWKLLSVTLPEIRQIEVVLGPTSAVYGFNAYDGVVNILTKDAEEMGTLLQVGGGEFGTLTGAAIHSGKVNQWSYRVSSGWDQAQQWRDRDALAFRAYKFNLHTKYTLTSRSTFQLLGGFAEANRDDAPVTRAGRFSSRPSSSYAYALYEHPQWLLNAWWNRVEDHIDATSLPALADFFHITDPNGKTRNDGYTDSYNLLGQHSFEWLTTHVTMGINYRYTTLSSNFSDGFHDEDRLGVYVQDEWPITSDIRLISGVRYDLSSAITPTLSPRIALIVRPQENHTLRFSYSEAFRPPTLVDRHLHLLDVVTLPGPSGSLTRSSPNFGSSDLKPEHIRSYELDYQGWFFQHRLRVRTAVFYNELSQFIGFSTASTTTFQTVNGGDAEILGGEIGFEALMTPWLRGLVNAAYQDIDQTILGGDRRAGPEWKINGGLRLDSPLGFNGEILVHYVGATTHPLAESFALLAPFGAEVPNPRLDSYTLLNLRGGYRFWNDKAEVALSVFNALNDRHREHPVGDPIGSRVMGWLTLRL